MNKDRPLTSSRRKFLKQSATVLGGSFVAPQIQHRVRRGLLAFATIRVAAGVAKATSAETGTNWTFLD